MTATTVARKQISSDHRRGIRTRLHAIAFRAQLGPTREMSWREFSPRH